MGIAIGNFRLEEKMPTPFPPLDANYSKIKNSRKYDSVMDEIELLIAKFLLDMDN